MHLEALGTPCGPYNPGWTSLSASAASAVHETAHAGGMSRIVPALPGGLNSPSGFFPLIGTVADMAKGPSRLGAELLPVLLRPKLDGLLRPKVDVGLPLGAPSFLSPVSRLAAPRSPF